MEEVQHQSAADTRSKLSSLNVHTGLAEDSVFFQAPIGISITDTHGRFIQVNPYFCDFLGYTQEELLARTIMDVTHPEDRTLGAIERNELAHREEPEFLYLEKRYVHKQGHTLWGSLRFTALKQAQPPHHLCLGMLEDISSRKRMEEDLKSNERLFSAAFNNAGIGMAILDVTGRFLEVNRSFCEFLGYTAEQIKSIDFQSITHPEDLSSDLLQFEALLAGDISAYAMHKRYVHASGEVRWGALSVSVSRNEGGDLEYVLSQIQDIHPQKTAEEKSRAQTRLYESVFSSAFSFMGLLNADGLIQEINLNAQAMTGINKELVLQYPLDKCYWFHGLPEQQQRIRQAIEAAKKGESVHEEIKILGKEGVLTLDFSLRPVFDPHQKVTHLIAEGHDITHLKNNEKQLRHQAEQLQRHNKDLQDFTHIASHDLQEPLRKIRAFGERLADQESLSEKGKDFLARMNNSAERMQYMIQDLLTYSRIDKQTLSLESVSLNTCIERVLESLSLQIEETRAQITIGHLPMVQSAPVHMEQLFQNLLSNALKFSRPGVAPEITVTCSLEGAVDFQIEITDNGIGFDPVYSERIFQPFQRLHSRHEYTGSGIGLAICRKIVDYYQGKIWVESTPGEGSCFFMVLPFAQPPMAIQEEPAS